MEKNINFIVKEDEKNLRVDVLINKREELISRTRIKNLILKEKLKLNSEIIKSPSKKVSIGDIINAIYLNGFYLILSIYVFYYSFDKARDKGTLINIGE